MSPADITALGGAGAALIVAIGNAVALVIHARNPAAHGQAATPAPAERAQ